MRCWGNLGPEEEVPGCGLQELRWQGWVLLEDGNDSTLGLG